MAVELSRLARVLEADDDPERDERIERRMAPIRADLEALSRAELRHYWNLPLHRLFGPDRALLRRAAELARQLPVVPITVRTTSRPREHRARRTTGTSGSRGDPPDDPDDLELARLVGQAFDLRGTGYLRDAVQAIEDWFERRHERHLNRRDTGSPVSFDSSSERRERVQGTEAATAGLPETEATAKGSAACDQALPGLR